MAGTDLVFTLSAPGAEGVIAKLIQVQGKFDDALKKTIGLTREQLSANAALIKQHKESNELVSAFKKHQLSAVNDHKRALIEEGRTDIQMVKERKARRDAEEAGVKASIDKKKAAWRSFIAEVQRLHPTSQQVHNDFIARQNKLTEAVRLGTITQAQYNAEIGRMKSVIAPGSQQTDQFMTQMVGLASTYIGVGQALRGIKMAMEEVRKEAADSLQLLKGRSGTMGELFQIAEGNTPEEIAADHAKMVKEAESASTKYGWNFAETLNVRKEARNAGADAQFEEIMKYAHLTRDPETVAKAVGQFTTNFGEENLDFKSIANTSLVASQGTPIDLGDIFKKLGASSITAKNVGSSSDEFMAYYSALAKGYGNADKAADALGYLISKGQMEGMGGEGIGGIVNKMTALPPEERTADIGERMGLNQTLNILSDPASQKFVATQKGAVERAKLMAQSPDSPLEIRNKALLESREMGAVVNINRAEALADISKRHIGIEEAEKQRGRLLAQSENRITGEPALIRGFGTAIGDLAAPITPTKYAGAGEHAGMAFARGAGTNLAAAAGDTPRSEEAIQEAKNQSQLLKDIRDDLRANRPNTKSSRGAAQAQAYFYGGGM